MPPASVGPRLTDIWAVGGPVSDLTEHLYTLQRFRESQQPATAGGPAGLTTQVHSSFLSLLSLLGRLNKESH